MNVPVRNMIHGESGVKIAESIEAAIRTEKLAPGDRLPTVRDLAGLLEVSPTTVSSAYRRLQSRGMIQADGRRGTKVCSRPPVRFRMPTPTPEGVRNLASGNPDPELLPRFRTALATLDPDPELYGVELNLPELLGLAREQFEQDGIPAASVAVVSGALDGIERVLREHTRTGDRVAVEDPGFPGIFDLVRGLGLILVPIPVDSFGILPDQLERSLRGEVHAVVISPVAQNPTGAAFDDRRIAELQRVLQRHPETLWIEDDHVGPLAGVPRVSAIYADQPHWAVIRSVSKSLGPDLRTAVMAGDDQTIAGVEGKQLLGTRWVSHLLQRVVTTLWQDPETQRLLSRAAKTYASRREAVLEALAEQRIDVQSRSGLNVWIPVEEEAKTVQRMLSAGWMLDPGERYRLQSAPGVRVTVAALDEKDAPRFAQDLASCIRPLLRTAHA